MSPLPADTLDRAQQAIRTRESWSAFAERPDREPGADEALATARVTYESTLGSEFVLDQPTERMRVGDEMSPYTGRPLGIAYPVCDVDGLFAAARAAREVWREVPWQRRVQICVRIIDALHERLFEIAHANMHTTGQSLSMSCVGAGTNALDRGLEALGYAAAALERVPTQAAWRKQFGRTEVHLDKRWRAEPRGIGVVITCASFPTWNAYPALLADLATGNPVIVKPHPTSVLTMALAVRTCQEVLAAEGLPPTVVQLAADTAGDLVTTQLVEHPDCAIVDFTGSPAFGAWVESHAHPAIAFTETAGINAVVLHSVADLPSVASAIATSLCLFTAQMCTSVQNVYLPRDGVTTPDGLVSADDVETALVDAVRAVVDHPTRAAALMGAVQSRETPARVRAAAEQAGAVGRVLLAPSTYLHPEWPDAWTCTPAVVSVDPSARALYADECFGPVAFVVRCTDSDDALDQALADVAARGTIASHVYSTDDEWLEAGVQRFWRAGASVTCNLTGPMPLNFAAAYSDFHVTGLSPAGNACLTDEAYIAGRFRVVQERRPARDPGQP